jgi:hypothetical protein
LVVAVILVAIAGCGGANTNPVSGTVTLDGEPLADALVMFTPMTGGRPAAAKTDSQGRYELVFSRDASGALEGEHLVAITTGDEIANDDGTLEIIPERVPTKYNSASELRATIESGSNVFDFALDSAGEIEQITTESADE